MADEWELEEGAVYRGRTIHKGPLVLRMLSAQFSAWLKVELR